MSHHVVYQKSHEQKVQEQQLEVQLRHVVRKLKTPLAREEHCSLLQSFEQIIEVKVYQRRNYQS